MAHPGWGEALFVKDIFPRAPLLNFCEYYYGGVGSDIGFDRQEELTLDAVCRARARNANLLLSLEACDAGVSPTNWQRSRHPAALRDKIAVIFDGIDTQVVKPAKKAQFTLPDGSVLTRDDEVVTYVARNLEPYRGYPNFIRALPRLLELRPKARVVIVGGDEVSYGKPPEGSPNWREHMAKEVALDPARVHFTGKLGYAQYLSLLQVSSLHIYLTVPFVLSWSCMEALAAGCLVLASDTAPVKEVIADEVNGLLVDFHSPGAIAERAAAALAAGKSLDGLRKIAREQVIDRYSLAKCLPRQVRLVHNTAQMRG